MRGMKKRKKEGVGEKTWIRKVKEKQKGMRMREEAEKVEDRAAGETGKGREKGWRGRKEWGKEREGETSQTPYQVYAALVTFNVAHRSSTTRVLLWDPIPTQHTPLPSRHDTSQHQHGYNTISTSTSYRLRIWTESWKTTLYTSLTITLYTSHNIPTHHITSHQPNATYNFTFTTHNAVRISYTHGSLTITTHIPSRHIMHTIISPDTLAILTENSRYHHHHHRQLLGGGEVRGRKGRGRFKVWIKWTRKRRWGRDTLINKRGDVKRAGTRSQNYLPCKLANEEFKVHELPDTCNYL